MSSSLSYDRGGECSRSTRVGQRLDANLEALADDFDAGRRGADLLGERACLVLRAGEVRAQHARQRGLGVVGGDADGIADPLGFGLEPSRLGMDLTEGDLGVPVAHRHPGLPHLRRSEISEPGNTGARPVDPSVSENGRSRLREPNPGSTYQAATRLLSTPAIYRLVSDAADRSGPSLSESRTGRIWRAGS
ncbi:MAG: hypothetical protein M0Z69_09625 [Actinomycetota bacterium]|nr:hypothetical protein [Actinomycetota bacterium]